VPTAERRRSNLPLLQRYTRDDLAVFSDEERQHLGIDDRADPQADPAVAWELLYRLEPELYDRLVRAERLHPGILAWLPQHVERIIEVACGTGRLTVELVGRCRELTAIEPAAPLREILMRKLDGLAGPQAPTLPSPASGGGKIWPNVRVIDGFFDALPMPDRSAELVITLSALTPAPSHGGHRGLAELERICSRRGMVVIVWPNNLEWLAKRGYRYVAFQGDMAVEFASFAEAIELTQIFYPHAVEAIKRRGHQRVPYDVLGINPPRDLAYKTIA
jgi:SAM-dependent methyltransferase